MGTMSFFRRLAPRPSVVLLCPTVALPGCLLDWEEKDTVVQECPAGSSCDFDCTEPGRCLVECNQGSTCTVDCANTEDCIVECGIGAKCSMACEDAGGCSLDCDSGATGSCSGACDITNINATCDQR